MEKRLIAHTAVCWLIAAGAASRLGIASGQDTATPPAAKLLRIVAGTDYLQTGPGTEATLPLSPPVTVQLTGVPIPGFGNADTIIQRGEDAVFSSNDPGPDVTIVTTITVMALNLTGTIPGNPGSCTVNITLAPGKDSYGTLILTKTSNTGGKYNSRLGVFINATFTPIGTGSVCYPPITSAPKCTFAQNFGKWSITPVAGEFLYTGAFPGVPYNQHTGLPAGYADFYMTVPQVDKAKTAAHATCEAFAAVGTPCP